MQKLNSQTSFLKLQLGIILTKVSWPFLHVDAPSKALNRAEKLMILRWIVTDWKMFKACLNKQLQSL